MVGWHHRLNGHEFEQAQEMAKDGEAWHAVHGVAKHHWAAEQQTINKISSLRWVGGISKEHSSLSVGLSGAALGVDKPAPSLRRLALMCSYHLE